MGLTIDYLYSLTPRQFFNIQKGWNDRRVNESNERLILTRKIMFAALLPHTKKEHQLTEKDIWTLPFEVEEKTPESQLIADLEAAEKYWEQIDKRRNQKPPH